MPAPPSFLYMIKCSSKLFCVKGDSSQEEAVELLSEKVLDVIRRINEEEGRDCVGAGRGKIWQHWKYRRETFVN